MSLLDTDYLSATLENSLLGFELCLAQVPLCSLRQNFNPTLNSPGRAKHPNLKRMFVFALNKCLETKHDGLGFASASSSSVLISRVIFDMVLCFLFERTWLQENIEKFMALNK